MRAYDHTYISFVAVCSQIKEWPRPEAEAGEFIPSLYFSLLSAARAAHIMKSSKSRSIGDGEGQGAGKK